MRAMPNFSVQNLAMVAHAHGPRANGAGFGTEENPWNVAAAYKKMWKSHGETLVCILNYIKMVGFPHVFVCLQEANQLNHRGSRRFNHEKVWVFLGLMDGHPTSNIFAWFGWWKDWNPRLRTCQQSRSRSYFFIIYCLNRVCKLLGFMKWVEAKDVFSSCMIIFVFAVVFSPFNFRG